MKKVTVLQLENMDHRGAILVWINPSEKFFILSIHSIYNEPVIAEFQVERERIVLKGVRTKSPAVLEYYGFDDMKEFHSMNQRFGTIYFKWGIGKGQELIVGDRKIYLSEIGEKGDRIRLRVRSVSFRSYVFSTVFGDL